MELELVETGFNVGDAFRVNSSDGDGVLLLRAQLRGQGWQERLKTRRARPNAGVARHFGLIDHTLAGSVGSCQFDFSAPGAGGAAPDKCQQSSQEERKGTRARLMDDRSRRPAGLGSCYALFL